jgi:hypothetical protein
LKKRISVGKWNSWKWNDLYVQVEDVLKRLDKEAKIEYWMPETSDDVLKEIADQPATPHMKIFKLVEFCNSSNSIKPMLVKIHSSEKTWRRMIPRRTNKSFIQ